MIFVTGGTGFLGRHLLPVLCRAGYTLRILTRSPQQHPWLQSYPDVEVIQGDLRDAAIVREGMQGCRYVVHAAGLFSMWRYAGDFEATNVQGTQHILEAALASGIERLIHISTVAVVGTPIPGYEIDETHPARPADPYQMSKLQSEQLVRYYQHRYDLPAIILRPGAFYGPPGSYAFNRLFFTDPKRGIIMQMDGGYYVIFPVYVGDVARSVVLALQHGQIGGLYNICGECLSHRAAFDIICEQANIIFPRLNLPGWIGINFARFLTLMSAITRREPFYPVGLRSYVFNDWQVSSDRAKRELGFEPLSFEEGVRRTLVWYRAGQPDMFPELHCHRPE